MMINTFVIFAFRAVFVKQRQIRLKNKAGPSIQPCLQQYQTDRAARAVADEAQALRLKTVFPKRDHEIGKPLRLVNKEKTSAASEQSRRAGAELAE